MRAHPNVPARRTAAALLAACLVAALVPGARASQTGGSVYATVSQDEVVLGNELVERRWRRDGFATVSLTDKRPGGMSTGSGPDFRLVVGAAPVELPSTSFDVVDARVEAVPQGLRVTMSLAGPGIDALRIVEAYEGIAGFRSRTVLQPRTPLPLRGYTLDEVNAGAGLAPTIHAFRSGADWREPGWEGPDVSVGDPHAGTWRDTRSARAGEELAGPGQWVSLRDGGRSVFMVMERNDWPSSRASFRDGTAKLEVDYSADVAIVGPLEENAHVENPAAGESPGRHRVLPPAPYETESAFVGFGSHPDDEPWQFYKYLIDHRLPAYDKDVTFNSNGTDDNVRSTGAKDDLTEEVIAEIAPKARRLGIETFILDDGWQARSGDFEPDCGTVPGAANTDPRWDGTPATAKFAPRFSDCRFERVRELIAPMKLGLWMNPMHYHPRSHAYMSHPEWGCAPVGHAAGALSLIDPNGGSNEAGIGTWGPDAIGHVESRIREAITSWGVRYFKFDFLVWLDCAGQDDMYGYKERFLAMLERVRADHPGVTFQIDETNDYRLFPFESVVQGPSWFQNGSPSPQRLLHNLWNLSPYVPAFSLGQHFLGDIGTGATPAEIDLRMAAALPAHPTFFSDLREARYTDDVIDRARMWIDAYRSHRDLFTQMTYPLLDDPMKGGWTALQTWDPERGRGALLAFRQGSGDATRTIALRNVPSGMLFDVVRAPSGEPVGTFTSDDLRRGLEVTIEQGKGAAVLLITPARDPATVLTYDGPVSGRVGSVVAFSASLTGSEGPIEGAPVTFEFRGRSYLASTDRSGRASVLVKLTGPPGTFEIVTSFPGSVLYLPSQDRDAFRVSAGG